MKPLILKFYLQETIDSVVLGQIKGKIISRYRYWLISVKWNEELKELQTDFSRSGEQSQDENRYNIVSSYVSGLLDGMNIK